MPTLARNNVNANRGVITMVTPERTGHAELEMRQIKEEGFTLKVWELTSYFNT